MHAIQLNGRLRTPSRPRQQTSPSFTLAPRPPDPPPTTTRVFAALSPKKTTPEALRSLEEQWRNRRRDKLQELVKSKLTAADDEPALERPQAVKRDAEPPRRPTPSRPRIASLRGEEPRRRSTAAQSKSKPSVPALHSVQSTEIPLPSPPTTPESKLEHTTPPVPLRSPHRAVVNGKAAKARVNDRHKFSSDQPQDIKRHTTPRTLKVDLTGAAHDVSPILVGCLPPGVFQLVGENTTSIRVHRRKAGASKASMTIVKGDRSFVVLEHGRLLRTSKGGRFEKDVWLGEEVETWREVQELVERLKRKTPKLIKRHPTGTLEVMCNDDLVFTVCPPPAFDSSASLGNAARVDEAGQSVRARLVVSPTTAMVKIKVRKEVDGERFRSTRIISLPEQGVQALVDRDGWLPEERQLVAAFESMSSSDL